MDGFLPVLSEFCAAFAQRENRHIQNHIGCVTHAGRNGKYKQERPAVDVVHEDMQKDFRVPSAARQKFLFRELSVSAVCQMYRDCGRPSAWHRHIDISSCFIPESAWNNPPHDRWSRTG